MRTQLALIMPFVTIAAWCGDAIQPYETNPRYWQYEGAPVVLIGGSVEDNLFQIPDVEAHLDTLAAAGGNYVRCTMSSRDEGNLWPFAQREDGKYDLTQWNEPYWERFERFLTLAHERDIVVQIECWDRFDYAMHYWEPNPYRPINNVNYTVKESGMKNQYPNHPGSNENPFFFTVPALQDNAVILPIQQAHIDKMLSISLRFPNVLYCMDNETSGAEEWGAYWAQYISDRAKAAGVVVCVTEMWDDWNLQGDTHKRTLDHPEVYAFADVSQNNHQKGQQHWDNLQWALAYVSGRPRPLNNVKTYGADGGRFGDNRDGTERFWRSLVGGAASVRFHRPDSGLGLSELAKAHIRSARMFADAFDLISADAEPTSDWIRDREDDECYATIGANGTRAVYFTDGGSVEAHLPPTTRIVRWLDIETSTWRDAQSLGTGDGVTLAPPGDGHWLALIGATHE